MDEQMFQQKFNELLNKIKQLPDEQRNRLEQLAEQSKERRSRIQGSLAELQESLDYLRLSVKYLVFDLEATRRRMYAVRDPNHWSLTWWAERPDTPRPFRPTGSPPLPAPTDNRQASLPAIRVP